MGSQDDIDDLYGAQVRFAAVDWGSTMRRIYAFDAGGTVVAEATEPLGVINLPRDRVIEELRMMRSALGARPLLLAGMIGSDRGVGGVPYLACPIGLDDLVHNIVSIDRCTAIVRGAADIAGAHRDVMRGEETLVLGGVAAGMLPADALVCQPGTHNKWIRLERARISGIRTLMTGELFDLLRTRGLLSHLMAAPARDDGAFRDGVQTGLRGAGAFAALFSARARAVLDPSLAPTTASYVSGLLIGDDVRVGTAERLGAIHLIGSGDLVALYRRALAIAGKEVITMDARDAFIAGAVAIARRLGWL